MKFLQALHLFAILGVAAGASEAYNYDDQEAWKHIVYEAGTSNDCAKSANSPINVPASVANECEENTEGIQFNAGNCTIADMTFASNINGVIASYTGNCTKPTAVFPTYSETYEAAQFHIHTSCEHTIDGKGCDAELHVVHFSTDTDMTDPSTIKAAVVGFMMSKDAYEPNAAFDSLLNCWSANQNEYVNTCNPDSCDISRLNRDTDATCDDSAFDVYSMIPEGSGYYNYMGGLTTPPCSQIVRWNLMDKKVSITLLQWAKLANLVLGYGGYVDADGNCVADSSVASKTGSTSRVPQPLNGRTLTHYCNAVV